MNVVHVARLSGRARKFSSRLLNGMATSDPSHSHAQQMRLPSFRELFSGISDETLSRTNDLRTETSCPGPCDRPARPLYHFLIQGIRGELVDSDMCLVCTTRSRIETKIEEGIETKLIRNMYNQVLDDWQSSLRSMENGLEIDPGEKTALRQECTWSLRLEWTMLIRMGKLVKKIVDSAQRPTMTDLLARLTSAEKCIVELQTEVHGGGETLADLIQKLQSLLSVLERLARCGEERAERNVQVPATHRVTRAMKRRHSQAGG